MARPDAKDEKWLVVTDEWFDDVDFEVPEGIEIDRESRTVRCPFGKLGIVGSRLLVRHGQALYVEKASSGTFRLSLK